MAPDGRTIDTLHRDLSALRRQVSALADSVASMGEGLTSRETLRAAGRQAAYLGDEAQRVVRQHPVVTGLVALAALGAVVCLAMHGGRSSSRKAFWD